MDRSSLDMADGLEELLQSGFRYALSLTHNSAQADDLLQEACLSIIQADGPWHRGYLFTTIRNRFIDQYRAQARRPKEELGVPDYPLVPDETTLLADQETVDQALARLRPPEREALYLSTFESYTAQEIADLTGRPRGTILSLIHHAKGKLRDFLGGRRKGEKHERA